MLLVVFVGLYMFEIGFYFQVFSVNVNFNTNCNVHASNQHSIFDALGDITDSSCSKTEKFGTADGEKRLCVSDIDPARPCKVFSLGSANDWRFEEDIVSRTHCSVDTFDCTGDFTVPEHLRSRVTFHKICIGTQSSGSFLAWADVVQRYGVPTVLKMDIEGWEWAVLPQITQGTAPRQIAMELHACGVFDKAVLPRVPFQEVWGPAGDAGRFGKDKRYVKLGDPKAEIKLLMEGLRAAGMYLMDRHDNPFCAACSEIVLRTPRWAGHDKS